MICRALGARAGRGPVKLSGLEIQQRSALSGSTGTETWSCAMSQLPSIFRKHAVHRTERSVLFPFLKARHPIEAVPESTSSPNVSVRSRIS